MPLNAVSAALPCEAATICEYDHTRRKFRLYDPTLGFVREMDPATVIRSFQSVSLALQDYFAIEGGGNVVPFRR